MESINNVSFRKLIEAAETWGPDVSFSAVGFAQCILRDQRATYEQETGAVLTKFQSPEKPAPEVYESFAMRYTAPVGGMLREHMDLTTHPAMRTVVITARQTPGHVMLGPAFKGADGDQVLFGCNSDGTVGGERRHGCDAQFDGVFFRSGGRRVAPAYAGSSNPTRQ